MGVNAEARLNALDGGHRGQRDRSEDAAKLLQGNEMGVRGDQAYQGQAAVLSEHAPQAEDAPAAAGPSISFVD